MSRVRWTIALLGTLLAGCDAPAPVSAPKDAPAGGAIVEHGQALEAKRRQAKAMEGVMAAAAAQGAIAAYYAVRGTVPADNEAAGMSSPEAYVSGSVSRLEVSGYGDTASVTVTFTAAVEEGATLVFTGTPAGTGLAWRCAGGDLDPALRPPTCR